MARVLAARVRDQRLEAHQAGEPMRDSVLPFLASIHGIHVVASRQHIVAVSLATISGKEPPPATCQDPP
jgi:hypothetical protein